MQGFTFRLSNGLTRLHRGPKSVFRNSTNLPRTFFSSSSLSLASLGASRKLHEGESNKPMHTMLQSRGYHSYPDPNEKPVITTSVSSVEKQIKDKNGKEFTLDSKFNLEKMFPGVPVSKGINSSVAPEVKSTILSNGLTVATQEMPGLMSSFAFMIGTGSASEIQNSKNPDEVTTGTVHMLELTAFRSTPTRSHQQIVKEIEELGGIIQCISTRENIMYCVDVLRENLLPAIDILADSVLNPLLTNEEVDEAKQVVAFQENDFPGDILSRDAAQLAAYKGQPLGNYHFCPVNLVDRVTSESLHKFRSKHMFGENCFLSGAGVDHESFVRIIEEKFVKAGKLPSAGKDAAKRRQLAPSIYTGGMTKNERPLKEPFIKIAIAFEIGGWEDSQLVAACVMQSLLGGGSSFSAGGPGKGMYTRLYREALNEHHWVESSQSFVSIQAGSGIFGIDGACMPENAPYLIQLLIDQLVKLEFELVSPEELDRAKNMLKSSVMMQLESRLVLCEDIARQFVTFGKREHPQEVCRKIMAVTAEDIRNVAARMMQKPPSVGCVGENLSAVPQYESIASYTKMLRSHYQGQAEKQKKG